MADQVDSLSDAELRTKLAENGFPVMPITASTRPLLVLKLKVVLNNKFKCEDSGDNRKSLAAAEEAEVKTPNARKGRPGVSGFPHQACSRASRTTVRRNTISNKDCRVQNESTLENGSKLLKVSVENNSTVNKDLVGSKGPTVDKSSTVETDNEKLSEPESPQRSPKTPPEEEEIVYMEWE